MSEKLFRISGRVIHRKTREGAAGLRVEAIDKELILKTPLGSASTDADGAFLIELSKGPTKDLFAGRQIVLFFRVFSDKELVASTEDSVLWDRDHTDQEITIKVKLKSAEPPKPDLETPFVIQGQIQRATGGSFTTGTVRLFGAGSNPDKLLGETKTDVDGRFQIQYLPSEFKAGANAGLVIRVVDGHGNLLVASSSFGPQPLETVNLTVIDPEPFPVIDPFVIHGHIRDANGKPLSNIIVRLAGVRPDIERVIKETRTDSEGNYEIIYLPGEFHVNVESARLTVRVFDDQGSLLAASPLFQASREENVDLVVGGFQPRQFVIQGQLRGSDNSPAAGLIVRAFSLTANQETFLGEAQSDSAGFYKIIYTPPQPPGGASPLIVVRVFDKFGTLLTSAPPFLARPNVITDLIVPGPIKPPPNNQWIILHTGLALKVTIFIAVFFKLILRERIVIRELDDDDNILAQTPFSSLVLTPVTGTTGLPAQWLDPFGPWFADVAPAAEFLASPEFHNLDKVVLTVKPNKRSVKLQIMLLDQPRVPPPTVLLGAVEVCSQAESDRVAQAEAIQSGEIETLTGYLEGGEPVPLLEPNQTYTLRVRYDAESKPATGPSSTESDLVQEFRFATDAEEPKRLDPWMLGTTPDHEDRYHFYEDPVSVVFNDSSVVQLFNAYGKQLRVEVRAADGVAIPHHEIAPADLGGVPAEVTEPYRGAIKALVDAGLLPCAGSITIPGHSSYRVPITLRPLMAYTLDIVVEPPSPVDPNKAITPLYRRSFATSRFAGITALINELSASKIRHRALRSQVTGLPAGAPVATATDEEMQSALRAAGEQALPAPSDNGITIYWAKRAGSSQFSPHIIMIDASEPLWRTRVEPRLETVPKQDDPAFQRIVPAPLTALEVIEQGGTNITGFVRSTGGTRTLAIISDSFNPPPGGATITLALHRAESSLYDIAALTKVLAALPLDARAPWESDL